MKVNLVMLKFVALVLFVLCAILFFASVRYEVAMGLFAVAFACQVAAELGR